MLIDGGVRAWFRCIGAVEEAGLELLGGLT